MNTDLRYDQLVELEENLKQTRSESPDDSYLAHCRRAYELSQQLYEEYGEHALPKLTTAAARLGESLEQLEEDEAEITQLYVRAVDGLQILIQMEPQAIDTLAMLAELTRRLTVLTMDSSEENVALEYGRQSLAYFDALDELEGGSNVEAHVCALIFYNSALSFYYTQDQREKTLKEQKKHYEKRLKKSPITAHALLSAVEHCRAQLYDEKGKGKKSLDAKIAAVDWYKKSLAAQEKHVDMELLIYLADLAQNYADIKKYKLALPLLDEIEALARDESLESEPAALLLGNNHILYILCYSELSGFEHVEAHCQRAILELPQLYACLHSDAARVELLLMQAKVNSVAATLYDAIGDYESALLHFTLMVQHVRDTTQFTDEARVYNQLQSALLLCGDAYSQQNQQDEARHCFEEIIEIQHEILYPDDLDELLNDNDRDMLQYYDEELHDELNSAIFEDSKAITALAEERLQLINQ